MIMIDPELIQVRKDEILNINSLKLYLTELFEKDLNNFKLMQFGGGHANLTYLVSFNDEEYVLRRPPIGPIAPSSHDMSREHKVQKSLNKLFPLAPKSLHFCEDISILGIQFHIIERRNGYVIRKCFPSFVNLDKKYVDSLTFNSIDVLASLHLIDPSEVGLENLGKPDGFVERQLNGWEDRWKKSAHSYELSIVFDKLILNLRKQIPKPQHASILHNDFKWDNIMWSFEDISEPVALFDWDMCTLGDPLMDLGHMLNYWIDDDDPIESQLVTSMPIEKIIYPKKNEIINYYSKKTGFNIDNINWYYAFGAFKLAVILQQIFFRFLKGQTKDKRFANFDKRVQALIKRANSIII